jgi:uncharacterized membrane protein YraQ (UPF0718 family)
MTVKMYRWCINLLMLIAIVSLFLVFIINISYSIQWFNQDAVKNFKTLFISLVLEAFPFILLGVFVSAILQTFVSDQTIRKMIPKNPFLGIIIACGLGIIFPLCECGMIPIIRRLIQKGLPIYIAIVFILAGPILNPIVFASTYVAFRSRPEIAYSRMFLAFVVAFIIGLIIYKFFNSHILKSSIPHSIEFSNRYPVEHSHQTHQMHPQTHKFNSVFNHASDEFFEMGKYLIFGAIITSVIQTFLERDSLLTIGQGAWSSHLFMMGFAYILSICSTSDAFIASSFTTTFTTGSLLTFLVFGPMLDMKGTLMLLSVFKARFVLYLSILVIIIVFLIATLYEKIILIPYF